MVTPESKKIISFIFVCYITSLFCLAIGLDLMGIIYPLTKKYIKWKNVVLKGVILVLIVEIIEPVFGRAFDVNDIFLNTLGVLVSSIIYVVGKDIVKKCSEKQII